MQLNGLKSNQLGRLVIVKNEISKKGIPKSSIILFCYFHNTIVNVLWVSDTATDLNEVYFVRFTHLMQRNS